MLLQKLFSDHSEVSFSFGVIQEVTWLEFFVSVGGEMVLMAYIPFIIFLLL